MWHPPADLEANFTWLVSILSRRPSSLLILAGNSSTWKLTEGADSYDASMESCRLSALAQDVKCVDSMTWHCHCKTYRIPGGPARCGTQCLAA